MEEMGGGGYGKIRDAALQLRGNELAGIAVLLIVNFPVFRQKRANGGLENPTAGGHNADVPGHHACLTLQGGFAAVQHRKRLRDIL